MLRRALCLVWVAVLLVCLASCGGGKTPLTAEAFATAVQEQGYTVEMTTEGEEAYVLANNEGLSLSFAVSTGEKEGMAWTLFANTVDAFEKAHPVRTMSLSSRSGNAEYYHATGGEEFLIISRVDNTLLCCVSTPQHAKELKALFEELGYK
ncbi:MAG: hypothetical protein IJ518_06990 [Clostridia bacterium]|nr:hypothetical protein [Clostridia bacterium]